MPTPIDVFAALALVGGTFVGRPFAPKEREDDKDVVELAAQARSAEAPAR